jgi:hypothetical protein
VFENRVLMNVFGPKGDEVTGSWRKFYNEELHNLCSTSNNDKIEEDNMGGACRAHRGDERVKNVFGHPERKGSLGRPRLRWENNIKIDFKQMGLEAVS